MRWSSASTRMSHARATKLLTPAQDARDVARHDTQVTGNHANHLVRTSQVSILQLEILLRLNDRNSCMNIILV